MARAFRFLMLLGLACMCANARGQSNSVSIGLANIIIQGELNQFRTSIPFELSPAPAYEYSITGNVHGVGPLYSQLVPSSEPLADAVDAIHAGLSASLQGSVAYSGTSFPGTIVSDTLSSGTDGAFTATFSITADSTGQLSFSVSNVAIAINGQPDTTDELVFDSGAVTVTALFADVSVATLSATDVTVHSATLDSSVICPNNFQSWFIYGSGTGALSGSSAAVSLASSGTAQDISIPVSGLLAHTLYRYQAVAQDITGPQYGTVLTFRTLDSPPVSGTVPAFAGLSPVTIPVLASCSDPDGDALKVTSAQDGLGGDAAVTKGGAAVTYRFTSATLAKDHFSYGISDGFGGSASGEVNVVNYATLAGTYSAVLLDPASNAGAGYLRLTLAATGACSGSLTISGVTYSFTGAFDGTGRLVKTLATSAPDGTTISLGLAQQGQGYTISSTVSMNALRLAGSLAGAAINSGGIYTMLLPPPPGASYVGSGYAVVQVAPSGVATVTGALPDGAAFSCPSVVNAAGQAGFFSLLYSASNRGSLAGALSFAGNGQASVSGSLVWTKPALASAGIDQGPFSITLTGSGGLYVPPVKAAALQFGTFDNIGSVALTGGNLNTPIQHMVSIAPGNLVSVIGQGSDRLALTIVPATGLFTGHFVDPLNGVTRTIHGALLQGSRTGGGYFLGDSIGGAVGIAP